MAPVAHQKSRARPRKNKRMLTNKQRQRVIKGLKTLGAVGALGALGIGAFALRRHTEPDFSQAPPQFILKEISRLEESYKNCHETYTKLAVVEDEKIKKFHKILDAVIKQKAELIKKLNQVTAEYYKYRGKKPRGASISTFRGGSEANSANALARRDLLDDLAYARYNLVHCERYLQGITDEYQSKIVKLMTDIKQTEAQAANYQYQIQKFSEFNKRFGE
jgi:hypothetical protein